MVIANGTWWDVRWLSWDSGNLEVPGEGSSWGELIVLNAIKLQYKAIQQQNHPTIHVDGIKYRDTLIEAEIREWILIFTALHIVLSCSTALLILFSMIFHRNVLRCKQMSCPLTLTNSNLSSHYYLQILFSLASLEKVSIHLDVFCHLRSVAWLRSQAVIWLGQNPAVWTVC